MAGFLAKTKKNSTVNGKLYRKCTIDVCFSKDKGY